MTAIFSCVNFPNGQTGKKKHGVGASFALVQELMVVASAAMNSELLSARQ